MLQRAIVLKETGAAFHFQAEDLPLLIHGVDKAGASFFSVTAVVDMFLAGNKFLFFTAHPMAQQEFLARIAGSGKEEEIGYIENAEDIAEAAKYQAVIIKSGDSDLCVSAARELPDAAERIIFVKNIEAILTPELFSAVKDYPKVILSGDIDKSSLVKDIAALPRKTTVLFSEPQVFLGITLPSFEKYSGFMTGRKTGVIAIQQ